MKTLRLIARFAFVATLTSMILAPRSATAQIQMWDVGLKVGAAAPASAHRNLTSAFR